VKFIAKIQLLSMNSLWTQNRTLTMDTVTAAPQETWDPPQESYDQIPQMLLAGCSQAEPSQAEPSRDQLVEYDWWN